MLANQVQAYQSECGQPKSRADGLTVPNTAASRHCGLFAAGGAMSSLKAQSGISPELVGVSRQGLPCAPRARPASKAARICAGSKASGSLPTFTLSGIPTVLKV